MSTRTTPASLPDRVRTVLAEEKKQLAGKQRPRGKAGRRHDRQAHYLTTILDATVGGAEHTPAAAGHLVTLRHAGDVEHRTYLLTEDGQPASGDHLALPISWKLGASIVGHVAGDSVHYEGEDGAERHVFILAVWDEGQDVWHLPDDTGDGPEER